MSGLSAVTPEPGQYIHWGVIQISVTNLAIIAAMILLFVLALVVPFPSGHGDEVAQGDEEGSPR